MFERSTPAQREEDKRTRHMDRSTQNAFPGAAMAATSAPVGLIPTKTPRPVRHTVWKTRGEEYRRHCGDGWMWLSVTRRNTSREPFRLIGHTSGDSVRPAQHGIGWGTCPDYVSVIVIFSFLVQ